MHYDGTVVALSASELREAIDLPHRETGAKPLCATTASACGVTLGDPFEVP